jgi:hypothetical protein
MTKATKISLTVPEETLDVLDELADEWDISRASVVKKLIGRGITIEMLLEQGGRLIFEHSNGTKDVILQAGIDRLKIPTSLP